MGQPQQSTFPYLRVIRELVPGEYAKGKHVGISRFEVNCVMCDERWIATQKQLHRQFCGMSKKIISDIQRRFNAKTYIQRDQRKAA